MKLKHTRKDNFRVVGQLAERPLNTRGLRFESSRSLNWTFVYCRQYWKDKNKEKRGREWPIKKIILEKRNSFFLNYSVVAVGAVVAVVVLVAVEVVAVVVNWKELKLELSRKSCRPIKSFFQRSGLNAVKHYFPVIDGTVPKLRLDFYCGICDCERVWT